MRRFITYSLKQLLDSTYFSLLVLYALLCWMIGDLLYTQKGVLSSRDIIDSYNMIIFSLVMMNSVYFIISHFRETLNAKMRDVLITRLGKGKYFWGLIICYFIYVIAFYFFPLYLTALFQQIVHGRDNIVLPEYLNSFIHSIARTGVWTIVLPIFLIIWLKNDLLTLVIWSLIYFSISSASFISEQFQTIDGNLLSGLPLIISVTINILALTGGIIISRKLTEYEYNEKISGGIFSFLAGTLKFDLSKFHYKMLGLKTQNLFFIFGTLGFAFILSMFRGLDVNSVVISKIYVAVFFPLLFSFNQYNLIAVDIESGMLATNLLRKIDYGKIVFNRWLTMLAPQIILAVVFSAILLNIIPGMNISFMALVILLNILFGSVNFFLSVYFNKSGYANFIIGFIAYLMLREDIQNIFISHKILNYFNIFGSITSFTIHNPTIIQIAFAFSISLVFIILTHNRLTKMKILQNL